LRYYFFLIVGGIALFVPGPWIASRILGHDLVESFLIFVALINVHHFILDGAIWKLRDGRIARFLLGKSAEESPVNELELRPQTFSHHLGWLFGPTRVARSALALLCVAVVAVGIVDQVQYYSTQRGANDATLAQAERLNPNDPRVYYRRAREAFAAGDTARARAQLDQVLAINPRNAPAQHLLGEIIFKSGDLNAALAHYNRMAELFRPDLSLEINRGLLARQVGQPAFAVTRFEEALAIAPHKTDLHFLLAEALASSGRSDDALKQYELFATLFEDDPGSPKERDRLMPDYFVAGLKLGELYSTRKDLHAAEKRLQRTADVAVAFRHYSEAAEVLNRLTKIEEALGNTALADRNRSAAAQAAKMGQKR
jgi:tetratricopeptide (TPR) repeat protein